MNEKELKKHIELHHRCSIRQIKRRFHEDLSYVSIKFAPYRKDAGAAYNKVDKSVTYYIEGKDWEKHNEIDLIMFYPELIIHELTHAICDKYDLCDDFLDGAHNISFSIINYCLVRDIVGKEMNFYQPYDMQDEVAKVDPKKLDELINHIKFSSVMHLAYKSLKYADYIRAKILKRIPYREWTITL